MVHKPAGVVSTVRDPQGRTRVVDLLPPEVSSRLYPVGRLDLDSEGLILLTNDGTLAHRLMHPRYQVPKHYRVWVKGEVGLKALEQLRQGVPIEGGVSAPARVHVKSSSWGQSKLNMVILEGRKREIRQMCMQVGHPVKRLLRVGLGPLRLGDLPPGASRRLSSREIQELKKL
jgi:pseudouridine synthase